MYSKEEIARAEQAMKMDMHIADLCGHIAQIYKHNPPAAVYCFMNGNVRIELGAVSQNLVAILKEQLKNHILTNYPAMEYLFAAVPVGGEAEWKDPRADPPPKGEYLVITDTEYAIKAVHFGNNEWECGGQDLRGVRFYQNVPTPPAGIVIGSAS